MQVGSHIARCAVNVLQYRPEDSLNVYTDKEDINLNVGDEYNLNLTVTTHANEGGNAFLGITNFDISSSLDDVHLYTEWTVTKEATLTEQGTRERDDLLHGSHISEQFNYKAQFHINDCASWHNGHFQIVVSGAPKANYTLANKNDISLIRGGETINPVGDLPKDLFTCNGSNDQLELSGGWFRYLFCGNWSDSFAQVFHDGDIIHFNATTFIGYDQDDTTKVVCRFDVDAFDLILTPDEGNGNYHVLLFKGKVELHDYEFGGNGVSGTPWYKNAGLQFYAEHLDTIPVYDDGPINNGKFRGMKSSCIQVVRDGTTYNISKANDGWIDALRKETSEGVDRWWVNFGSSSIDLSVIGGSIQSGDIVQISGIFYSHATGYAVVVSTKLSVSYNITGTDDGGNPIWTLARAE
ncbi:MAG: hypothetical protein J6M95_03000 [Bacilli bacterium]|nr:hypothetical protein [Bacilli bacterium]